MIDQTTAPPREIGKPDAKKNGTHLENATRFKDEQAMTDTLPAPHDLTPTHTAPDTYQARRRGTPTGYKRFAAWTHLGTPVP
jgi:hypothetical protein